MGLKLKDILFWGVIAVLVGLMSWIAFTASENDKVNVGLERKKIAKYMAYLEKLPETKIDETCQAIVDKDIALIERSLNADNPDLIRKTFLKENLSGIYYDVKNIFNSRKDDRVFAYSILQEEDFYKAKGKPFCGFALEKSLVGKGYLYYHSLGVFYFFRNPDSHRFDGQDLKRMDNE